MAQRVGGLSRMMVLGERGIAAAGLSLMGLLLVGTALSMWWAGSSQRETLRSEKAAELKGINTTLGETAKALVLADDLAGLRRVVVEARDAFGLAECRVSLPDGKIVADGEPGRITAATLPAHWGSPLDAEAAPSSDRGPLTDEQLVLIPGHGMLKVFAAATIHEPGWTTSEMQSGLSLIGAMCVGGMLMVYRRMRGRLAVMELIHEGLGAVAAGRRSPDELCLDTSFGQDAVAWNALVSERAELNETVVAARAREVLSTGRGNGTELEAAVGAMADGVIVLAAGGKIRYANGAACVFLGSAADSLAGEILTAHVKDLRVQQAIEQVLSGRERQRRVVESEQAEGDGRAILRYEIRPMRRGDVDETMIVIHDVTQQRVADESRNAFVAQVTHELRTPLTTIRLYLEMLAEDGETDPAVRAKCLNVISGESRRLEHVVSEMLSVAEIEAGAMTLKYDDVRLDALLAGLREEYAGPAKEKGVELVFELPPKLPVIHADRERLAMALHNLLGNAVKYTPSGGMAKVAVQIVGKQLQVEISDTGIGIDEKEHEKVFQRFYRAKDPRVNKITGTGLGLPLAREIARLHGGDVTLQSQLNKGTRFTLSVAGVEG